MSFLEYKKQVIKFYEEKRDAGLLSFNLQKPTCANLRKECLAVISKRYRITDNRILTDFFGDYDTKEEYIQSIGKTDPDKFKPLFNHLNKKTEETNEKNIELLAWLIDFEPRPYVFTFSKDQPEGKEIKEALKEDNDSLKVLNLSESPDKKENENDFLEGREPNPVHNQSKNEINSSPPNTVWGLNHVVKRIAICGLVTLLGVILWVSFGGVGVFKEKNCMYWAGDRFEHVYCNQMKPNVQVVALDTFRLNYFKKITQLDTLTEKCIGKIWYSKIENEVEFFTTGGMHPERMDKALKPVSKYIYEEYIRGKKAMR